MIQVLHCSFLFYPAGPGLRRRPWLQGDGWGSGLFFQAQTESAQGFGDPGIPSCRVGTRCARLKQAECSVVGSWEADCSAYEWVCACLLGRTCKVRASGAAATGPPPSAFTIWISRVYVLLRRLSWLEQPPGAKRLTGELRPSGWHKSNGMPNRPRPRRRRRLSLQKPGD